MGQVEKWIALNNVPNLGPRRIAAVYRETSSIDSFFVGEITLLSEMLHVKVDTIRDMLAALDVKQGRDIVANCRKQGISLVCLEDPEYPSLLREIYDPPSVLYYRGRLSGKRNLLGVVGSRKATHYGRAVISRLVPRLCHAGLGIVSGLAAGIDSYAHWASLKADGYTLGVLGNGVDIYYPAANRGLQDKIVSAGGCILSEFPPGTRARAHHFPRRNRIISGLCHGLLVAEAGLKSGAMITVGFALEQGRDVFSVPGNIDSPQSGGANHLIRMGAKPALSSRDILEEYGLDMPLNQAQVEAGATLNKEEEGLLALIDAQGISVDELCYLTGLPGGVILARLVALELRGAVTRLPGQKYARCNGTEV